MSVYTIREERDRAVVILCEEYPRTFFIDPKRRMPLKHGIEKDIEISLADNKNSKLLDYDFIDAVEWYRSHVSYKKACGVAGSGRIDLRGNVVAKVTEAEARIAEQEAAEAFAVIEARKRQTLPKFVTQPPALPIPIRQAKALPVDTNLSDTEMLAAIEKQANLARTILGDSSDGPLRAELVRPALRLMIDELNTIIARLDEKGRVLAIGKEVANASA